MQVSLDLVAGLDGEVGGHEVTRGRDMDALRVEASLDAVRASLE